jgi:glucose-1-phosphate adenylyltransferase
MLELIGNPQRPAPAEAGHWAPVLQPVTGSNLELNTYAMVLAGGRGARLQPLTDDCAKSALPFAGSLRMVDFVLGNCVNSGIRHIELLTQYKAQSLIRHVACGWNHRVSRRGEIVDVVAAQQQDGASGYLGTADAVYQNLELMRKSGARYVLVLASDHVYKMDYRRIIAEHVRRQADVTVACIEVPLSDASAFGVVRIDDTGRIREFDEKPARPSPVPGRTDAALVSMGIYVFGTDFLCRELARDALNPASWHDFGHDIIPSLLARHCVMAHDFSDSCVTGAGVSGCYWRDVGTLDAYWSANMDFIRANAPLDLYDEDWPIHGQSSAMAGARFVPDTHGQHGCATDSLVCGGCVVQGATVLRSLLFPGARVGSGSVVEDTLLLPGASIGRGVRLRRAIVASGCVVPDGTLIGISPSADSLRFFVTPQGVTLVTPSMLQVSGGAGTWA